MTETKPKTDMQRSQQISPNSKVICDTIKNKTQVYLKAESPQGVHYYVSSP